VIGEELIAFCLVLFLFTGEQAWMLEKPYPLVHHDTTACMNAVTAMGKDLTARFTVRGVAAQSTCGCMGLKEARKLNLLPPTHHDEKADAD